MGNPIISYEMPLHPKIFIGPFEKWEFHFVGPINPPSKGNRFILVYTNYVTKWEESKAIPRAIKHVVVSFLSEGIIVRFGFYHEIVMDRGAQFTSKLVQYLTKKYNIRHKTSTPYHPQGNGQVESKNIVLEEILLKYFNLIK